jgi:hypothetical protein
MPGKPAALTFLPPPVHPKWSQEINHLMNPIIDSKDIKVIKCGRKKLQKYDILPGNVI